MKKSLQSKHSFHYKTLSVAVAFLMINSQTVMAETSEPHTTLDTIVIQATTSDNEQSISDTPHTNKTTSKQITEQLIMDSRDLVKYNPEVSVGEVGRYGSKGFNIQGVDGNRVAMLIDGVAVPEVETNEFFTPYGYMNDSRFMTDVEMLQSAEINKGADSLNSGNGAIGGAVDFKTREPENLVKAGKEVGGYLKTGYTSKNEEFMNAIGLGFKKGSISGLLNYARREGHELKNHDMRSFDDARLDPAYIFPDNEKGTAGIYPDPMHYEQDSFLAKMYYAPTPSHKFGIHGSHQYTINQNTPATKVTYFGQNRQAFDENERNAYGFNYEYTPDNSTWLSNLKLDFTKQEVITVADTYIYSNNAISNREYRPNYFDVNQWRLTGETINLLPPENKTWLGEHTANFGLQFAKQSYDPYMIYQSSTLYFENPSAMMLPTDTDIFSAFIKDNIYLNEKVSMNAGLRYDNYERQVVNVRPAYIEVLNHANTSIGNDYRSGKLLAPQEKDAWTWQTGIQYQPKPDWQATYQIGTGFLMPLSNQSFSGFAMNGIEQMSNPNLQPEESLNQQISLQKQWDNALVKLTAYYNKYDNFIDTHQYDRNEITFDGNTCNFSSCFQYINKQSATSKGVGLSGFYNFAENRFGNFGLKGQLAYQKGSASDGSDLLAIQPLNGLIGINYKTPNERFDINAVGRFFGKKDADTTKRYRGQTLEEIRLTTPTGTATTDDLTKNVWVFDVYGNVKLSKALSLQAGVYNLTDEKYIPWDNLRTLATVGINNMVSGDGINRYTAPGRNFALSLHYQF